MLNIPITIASSNPPPRLLPKRNENMSTGRLVHKRVRQPDSPWLPWERAHASSNRRWVNTGQCSYTMEHSAIKGQNTDTCCTGVNLKNTLAEQNLTQVNADCVNHTEFWKGKTKAWGRHTISGNRGPRWGAGHRGTFCTAGDALCLDCGGGSGSVWLLKNSNCTLKMSVFH